MEMHACEESCSCTCKKVYCENVATISDITISDFVIQILRFMSGRLLYGIMKLYGVYGVNNLNTPFNVTYTKGRWIRECERTWGKQTEVWVTLFVVKTSLDTVRCKT